MQVAIVTGASSGIGFGCATKLAEAGMAVVGTGRDEGMLADLANAINDKDRVATIAVDLTADDAPKRIVDLAVERWGRIDFLVNNAGVGKPKPLHETDDESLDYFLGLMLRAPFRLARDVIPHMQSGSAIINVTSTFAVVGGLLVSQTLTLYITPVFFLYLEGLSKRFSRRRRPVAVTPRQAA